MDEKVDLKLSDITPFPLPFRILLTIHIGVLFWLTIVYLLTRWTDINVLEVLKLSYNSRNYNTLDPTQFRTSELSTTIKVDRSENSVLIGGIFLTLRKITTRSVIGYVVYLPLFLTKELYDVKEDVFSLLLRFCLRSVPFVVLYLVFRELFFNSKHEGYGKIRVKSTVKRVLKGKINSKTMRTNDILLSDSCVSYNRVLNDTMNVFWTLFFESSTYLNSLEFMVLSIPLFIRIKQCWHEYNMLKQKQHFLNLIKYSVGLGPIVLSHTIKRISSSTSYDMKDEKLQQLHHALYFIAFINSTYSFIWDVKMDWGLGMMNILPWRTSSIYEPLRPRTSLLLPSRAIYYIIIMLDFMLRYIWFLVPLSRMIENSLIRSVAACIFGNESKPPNTFLVEVLEIFRRFLWCIVKIESDWIKETDTEQAAYIDLDMINKRS